ncbi:MAG TPA: hypothetical protein VMD99_15805 [Terriglobales bacterium]|nr:hypothetical protein [Terriglobales bacterium]
MRPRKLCIVIGVVLAIAACAPQLSVGQYSINTVAGGGPNNLTALNTGIGYAVGVVQDSLGNTYISDAYSNQVFKVDAAGILTLVAGNGVIGYSGDGGPATSATLDNPEGLALDASGNLYIADTDNSVIRVVNTGSQSITVAGVTIQPGTIQTVAGSGTAGYGGDGDSATNAELNDPYGVFVDGSGNIFIADTDNCLIREVSGSLIATVAGDPTATQPCGYGGDGGAATSALLDQPFGVFVDSAGNIYIGDTDNSVLRVVNPGSQPVTVAGVTIPASDIETVAGLNYDSSDGGACQFSGDNGPATSAYLCQPQGVFVDGSGNIFIADSSNFAVREVVPGGTISTIAGTLGTGGYGGDNGVATSALLNYPTGIFVDSLGDVFIADVDNSAIRVSNDGTSSNTVAGVTIPSTFIETVAGNFTQDWSGDGGPAISAALNSPFSLFVDGSGNLFIADTYNSAIRKVTASTGNIQTLAGIGRPCSTTSCGDGSSAITARLDDPSGIFLDGSGKIYIADTENSAIRVVNTGASAITIAGTTIAPGDIQTVAGILGSDGYSGDGNAPTGALLKSPYGVAVDASGNIFIADTENSAIRVVNTGTAAITIAGTTIQPKTIMTVAGNGTACTDASSGCGDAGPAASAELNFPTSIAIDGNDNIYIADAFNNAIRVVNAGTSALTVGSVTIQPGNILTVAGTLGQRGYAGDNGPPTSALLDTPYGVYLDSFGNIYIGDVDNAAIREVVAVANIIQTIAGTGVPGFSGDGGQATSAELDGPAGVIGTASGNLYVAEINSSRIRELTSTVSIGLAPGSSTLPLGDTQQFLATVTGSASNFAVTWQVNNVTGGNSTAGTISSAGLYQAPVSSPGSAVTVTAIANANGSTAASARVTLAGSGTPAIEVSTSPSGVTDVYTLATQTFTATVSGESNTSVNWEVAGVAGGNATVGTISTAGAYTAPATVPSPALVLITAVSQASSNISASYPINIVSAPSASQPVAQTISPGSAADYSLSLNANTGNPRQPITLSCLQSSLPPGATCSFAPTTITPGAAAVPFGVQINVPTGEASLQRSRGIWLASFFAIMPLGGIFIVSEKRRRIRGRWLGLLFTCIALVALSGCVKSSNSGSGSQSNPELGTYTVQIQGTTGAQPTPTTITTLGLTVQ